MDKKKYSRHTDAVSVKITDKFWQEKLELVRNEVIPYQYEALHDRVENAEKSYSIENFLKAGEIVKRIKNGENVPLYPTNKWYYTEENSPAEAFHGWVFQDSDVYKWIEATGFSLINTPDEKLQKRAEDIIDIICAAALPDGYLDTLFIINNINDRFSNLKDWHELYCFGHLAEAAVSFYNATKKTKLLDAACRFADLICDTFGEDKIKGYPGHEIAEMALVKLYEVTGKEKYLETAKFFIDERGKKPYYYDVEAGRKTVYDNYHYNQAHCQPKFQYEAVGHAVRGVYLYSGMADIARIYNDDELYNACIALTDNIIHKKMYITGSIGATADGEAFSFDYDLPNDLAYSETCASIGLIFFLRRMLEIAPDSEMGDAIERALYNTVLSGMALDGKSFFYVNPLEVLPEASKKDSRKRHIKTIRQKWFGCACCPPNISRLISSLGEYIATQNDDSVYIHQYIGSVIETDKGRITMESDYTENGNVILSLSPKSDFTLALRIPLWCDGFSVSCEYEENDGYIYIHIQNDCKIKLSFNMKIRMIKCSNKVRANVGRVAVSRGPFIYCMEETDNGKNLQMLKISKNPEFTYKDGIITAKGFREDEDEALYSTWNESSGTPEELKFIPYFSWANRGEGEMQVYVRI